MQPIPLISAVFAGHLANALGATGVPVDRYLELAHISPGVREQSTGFIPGRSLWDLADDVERSEGLGNFWLDSALNGDWRGTGWARHLSRAATLREAIGEMCASYVREVPMNRLGLSIDGPLAWFSRRRTVDVREWRGSAPAEQFTLSLMLEVIRTAAGPKWLPEHLKVECARSGWAAATNRLPGVRIEYGQPVLAVAIPVPLLASPFSIAALPATGSDAEQPATDFTGSLRQVFETWFADEFPDQVLAAELLHTTPRTLCRRLADEGTCWRGVVNDFKFAKAVARLRPGRSSLNEIATDLGYSDPSHFTRFFRQRAGISPSAYRRELERAQGADVSSAAESFRIRR